MNEEPVYYSPGKNRAPWKDCGKVYRRTRVIMDHILENNSTLLSKLCDAIAGRDDTAQDYFDRAAALYKKYDQGSLSFTKTALRHARWDHPEEVYNAIHAVIKEGWVSEREPEGGHSYAD